MGTLPAVNPARPSAAAKTVIFKEARKVFGHNRLGSL
jgi:hypothetical protein